MKDLLEWIKSNAKEGANIAEAEELVQKSTFDGITTKEQALDFIGKNKVFTSALDSMVSKAVESHDERFKTEKLPEIVKLEKERLLKELNPEETAEQKRIRELEEKIAASEMRDKELAIKSDLRTKAQELGYDPIRAERFAAFGDKAIDTLVDESNFLTNLIDSKMKEAVKGTLSGPPPKGGAPSEGKPDLDAIEKMTDPAARTAALKEAGYL